MLNHIVCFFVVASAAEGSGATANVVETAAEVREVCFYGVETANGVSG